MTSREQAPIRRGVLGHLAVAVAIGMASCAWPGRQAAGTPPGATPRPTSEPEPPRPAMPDGLPEARVIRVVDGDTIDVEPGGRVRLIGIDTPEAVDPRRPVECYAREASEAARAMMDGQLVLLEVDPGQGNVDTFNRLLRFVWLPDGRMANFEQLIGGYAHEYTLRGPHKYRDLFVRAQRYARDNGIGLWARGTCAGHTARPAPTPSLVPTP